MKGKAILFAVAIVFGCSDEAPERGTLKLNFEHHIGGEPARFRSPEYVNAAGNPYEVTNIQWFISALRLYHGSRSTSVEIEKPFYHYIDSDLPETSAWVIPAQFPEAPYDSIGFIFGLDGDHNRPGQFVNPPESNMVWPFALGGPFGGYHYMKLNGFWTDASETRRPFNAHLGVGQRPADDGVSTEFIQNWFEVRIPATVTIRANTITEVTIIMNIESWFDTPATYDFNVFGGMIMTNQEAMHTLCENGRDAFDVYQNSYAK